MKIIFLLPLLLIGIPLAFAEETYRSDTYQDITHNDGVTHTWTGGLSPYLETGELDNQGRKIYKHYFISEQPDYITVQNGEASFVFDKTSCSAKIYDGGFITDSNNFILGSDSYVPKSSVDGSGTWSIVSSVNNSPCVTQIIETQNSVEVSGTKSSSAGIFKVRYLKEDGQPLKTILEATNLTSLTDRRFGVTQTQSIPQIITWYGQQKDLSNFVGQTFDRQFLEDNKASLFTYSNNLRFNVIDAWDNLESIKINSVNNGMASISFNYFRNTPILLPNETLIIDPTYGYTSSGATNYAFYYTGTSGTKYSDSTSGTASIDTTANMNWQLRASGLDNTIFPAPYWDISSIGTNKIITDVSLRWDNGMTTYTNMGSRTISINQITHRPDINTAVTMYNDGVNMSNGTVYVSNSTIAQTSGANKVLDLGTSADTYLQSKLGTLTVTDGWFGVAFIIDGLRDGSSSTSVTNSGAGTVDLQVTYIVPCSEPTNLRTNTMSTTQIDLYWTKPSTCSGLTNYKIYKSTSGADYTLYSTIGNVTTTSITGLSSATQSSFKVSANNTSTYHTNSTIGTNSTLPSPPIINTLTPVSTSQINVEFSDNSVGSIINWKKLRYAPVSGGAFVIFDTNSTISPRYENVTGLSLGTNYNFQVAEGNQGGFGDWSSNGTAKTYAVTTGTVTPTIKNIGDVLNATTVVSITAASPSPVTVSSIVLLQNNTIVQTNAVSQQIAEGNSHTFGSYYYLIPDGLPHQYKVRATVSTFNGTVNITSAGTDLTQEYEPTYFIASDITEGFVNYTIARTENQDEINLKVNRDKNGNTFQIECRYRTMTEAALNSDGVWHNYTGVGYMNDTLTNTAGTHYYIDCYNSNLLFNVVSYTNSSMLLAGIEVFDNTYGAFIGVPVGVFFIVLVAGMANQRTAPMWIVVILAIAGIMSAIGFFTLETNVWALALIAALLGIIVGRKLF